MKISKLFHWLYFAVMMLPLLVYPIFALAVRSDNNYQPISVDVERDIVVSFNQYVDYNDYDLSINTQSTYDYDVDGSSASLSEVEVTSINYFIIPSGVGFECVKGHVYAYYGFDSVLGLNLQLYSPSTSQVQRIFTGTSTPIINASGTFTCDIDSSVVMFYLNRGSVGNVSFDVNPMLTDLTLAYGAGNEPSINSFLNSFSNDYYGYTLNTPYLIQNDVVTLSDSDVGSQMVYVGYKVVDNYFNYDNVFNFGSLYSWLEINFFNGSAPLGFFIFWHLLIYWLLTSLLWLLFDVLIYVPMLIHRWLDKASLS